MTLATYGPERESGLRPGPDANGVPLIPAQGNAFGLRSPIPSTALKARLIIPRQPDVRTDAFNLKHRARLIPRLRIEANRFIELSRRNQGWANVMKQAAGLQ